jgi:hypothetical protein
MLAPYQDLPAEQYNKCSKKGPKTMFNKSKTLLSKDYYGPHIGAGASHLQT